MGNSTGRPPYLPLPVFVAHHACGHQRRTVVSRDPSTNIHRDALWCRHCRHCRRLIDVVRREGDER